MFSGGYAARTDTDANTDTNTDANANSDTNSDAHPNTDTNSDTDANTDPNTVANAFAQAMCGIYRDLRRYGRTSAPGWVVSHERFRDRFALGDFQCRYPDAGCRFAAECRVRG